MRTLAKVMVLGLAMTAVYPAANAFAYSPATPFAAQAVGFSKEDLKKLLEAKVSDGTIIAYIKRNSPAPSISAQDLVELRTAGASDAVLLAMVESSGATTSTPPARPTYVSPPSGADYAASQGSYSSVPYVYNDYSGYDYYPYGNYYPSYGYSFGFGLPFRNGDRFHHFNSPVGHFQYGTHAPVMGSHGTVRSGGSLGGGHGGGGGHR